MSLNIPYFVKRLRIKKSGSTIIPENLQKGVRMQDNNKLMV